MTKRVAKNDGLVLTVPQTAELLQVSENHVYNLCSQDQLPHFRAGKLIRIPRWGLMQFIATASGTPVPLNFDVALVPNESGDVQPEGGNEIGTE